MQEVLADQAVVAEVLVKHVKLGQVVEIVVEQVIHLL